jgi:two-component system sensor histidine kinase RegB
MNIEKTRQVAEVPQDTPLADLLGELADEVTPGQFDRVDVQCDPGIDTLRVQRSAVVQVLGILVQNALDASENREARVTLSIARDEKSLEFTVADHGRGMTSEQLSRIGEPFATTKSPRHGMGLGLFLARSIAEHLNGTLRLRSAPGHGTVAVLQFDSTCNRSCGGD